MGRGRPFTVSRALAAAAAAGLMIGACANTGSGRCPRTRWCAAGTDAAAVAEPATGTTFTCPIGLHAGVAREAGQTPPPGLPADLRVTLDEQATRDKRDAGDATTCCYAWTEPCKG